MKRLSKIMDNTDITWFSFTNNLKMLRNGQAQRERQQRNAEHHHQKKDGS